MASEVNTEDTVLQSIGATNTDKTNYLISEALGFSKLCRNNKFWGIFIFSKKILPDFKL